MNPYIDKSTNEQNEKEYTIHNLNQNQIEIILSALDWHTMGANSNSKAKYKTIELADKLNISYTKVDA